MSAISEKNGSFRKQIQFESKVQNEAVKHGGHFLVFRKKHERKEWTIERWFSKQFNASAKSEKRQLSMAPFSCFSVKPCDKNATRR